MHTSEPFFVGNSKKRASNFEDVVIDRSIQRVAMASEEFSVDLLQLYYGARSVNAGVAIDVATLSHVLYAHSFS